MCEWLLRFASYREVPECGLHYPPGLKYHTRFQSVCVYTYNILWKSQSPSSSKIGIQRYLNHKEFNHIIVKVMVDYS